MAPLWRFERHLAIKRTVPPGSPVADRSTGTRRGCADLAQTRFSSFRSGIVLSTCQCWPVSPIRSANRSSEPATSPWTATPARLDTQCVGSRSAKQRAQQVYLAREVVEEQPLGHDC